MSGKKDLRDIKQAREDLKRPANRLSSEDDSDSSDSAEEMVSNKFANDGSFLEMFKQMQQQKSDSSSVATAVNSPSTTIDSNDKNNVTDSTPKSTEIKRKPKVLKVGVIKKKRPTEPAVEEAPGQGSSWNQYLKEVRMYKEKYGDDEDKNRPLVK